MTEVRRLQTVFGNACHCRKRVWVAFSVVAMACLTSGAKWWWSGKLTVSPETTVITSPLLPDGRPDYVTFLNATYSSRVSSEGNAATPLTRLDRAMMPDEQEEHFQQFRDDPPVKESERWKLFRESFTYDGALGFTFESLADDTWSALSEIDRNRLNDYLAKNQASIRIVEEAGERPDYFSILRSEDLAKGAWTKIDPRSVCEWATAFDILSQKSLVENSGPDAARYALVTLRLGRWLSQEPTWESCSQAMEIEKRGIAAIGRILNSRILTHEEIRKLRDDLRKLPVSPATTDVVDENLRFNGLALACGMWSEPTWIGNQKFRLKSGEDINAILREINRRFDELRNVFESSDWTRQSDELRSLGSSYAEGGNFDVNFIANFVADVRWRTATAKVSSGFAVVTSIGEPRMYVRLAQAPTRRQLLNVGLAIAEYESVHGRYPERLQALVPEFLDAVPVDFWGQGPLHYSADETGFQIYSVGPDLSDDRGLDDFEMLNTKHLADDIYFGERMLPPKAESVE